MIQRFIVFVLLFLAYSLVQAQDNFTIIKEDAGSIWIKVQTGTWKKEKVQTSQGEAYVIKMEHAVSNLEKSEPDLPYLYTSLAIESGSYDVQVEDMKLEPKLQMFIAPSKGDLLRNINPNTVPYTFGTSYEMAFYPNQIASVSEAFIYGSLRGQTLKVQPFIYTPETKELQVIKEMVLKLTKKAKGYDTVIQTGNRQINQSFGALFQEKFLNYNGQASRYELVQDYGNMLIVAPTNLHESLSELVLWRRQMGIATTLVSMDSIGTTGVELDAFISEFYEEQGITFLLLVGDIDMIPTLNTGNDNACDHCFSYQSGDDHFPEFFVGRFPSSDPVDIARMVEKTLTYERTPNMEAADWFSTGMGIGSNQGPGDDSEYDYEHLNNIKTQLLDYTYTHIYEFYDGDQSQNSPTVGDATADISGNPSSGSIKDVLNSGASLLNYTGHGSHGALSSGNLDVGDLNSLVNKGNYAFGINVACCVGDFKDDFGGGDCFGEAWMKASNEDGSPAGGIGGCFSTILQSWAPPMEGQDEMNNLIAESTEHEIRHTIGSIVIHGCSSMIEAYGGGGENMMDSWSIFGDPSVVLRTAFPTNLNVSHVSGIPLGSSSLTVNCDMNNALVGLYYQDSLLASSLVENGSANLVFPVLETVGDILVTVTGFNKLPYQSTVEVVSSNAPFVTLNNYEIDDSEGNQNGVLDYSELVHLNVSLENLGGVSANLVSATLNTTHPDIEMINNENSWGDILNNASKNLDAAYTFKLADIIVDGMIIPFNIDITDMDGNAWQASINIQANAPHIEIPSYSMDDTQTGNGNHRIDAGETVQIIINNLNIGHANTFEALSTLMETNNHVSITDASQSLGVLNTGANVQTAVFEISVDESVPNGDVVSFSYEVGDGFYGAQTSFEFPMNLIVEDFESEDFETFNWTKIWEQDEQVNWFITETNPYEGAYCAQSGDIADNQSTTLRMVIDVFEDGEISFAHRTECEDSYDFLEFYINENLIDTWSGNIDWQEVSFPISAGEQTYDWVFVKDGLISAYSDAVWVDNIVLPPHNAVISSTKEQAIDNASISIYPIPAQDIVNIEFDLQDSESNVLRILNSNGQTMHMQQNLELNEKVLLDVGNYPSGMYMVQVRTEDKWISKKLIIQH